MIRVSVHSTISVTVTDTPHWLARWLLGQVESVRGATHTRPPGGQHGWMYSDTLEDVDVGVFEAIECAVTRFAVQQRLNGMRR